MGKSETVGLMRLTFYMEFVMKCQKVCRILAFVACGGVLLQTGGCSLATLLPQLASAAIPLALQILLSGLTT